ncbi:MAG: ATP-binding protein, partial [Promethearchaeota archaeon]
IINITREKTDEDCILIEFVDNGKGIEDERKESIFLRGTTDKGTIHGMGIGLSLVKMIIDGYKGKIWVEDRIKG